MRRILSDLWEENNQNMETLNITGRSVVYNGEYFSDAEYFIKNKAYKVLESEEMGFTLRAELGIEMFIFPDGLSAFEITQ